MRAKLLISELLNQPWALRREVLRSHAQIVAQWLTRDQGQRVAFDDDYDNGRERISAYEARRRDANAAIGGNYVAVIPIYGTIVQRSNMFSDWCGGSSCQNISQALNEAVNDPNISEVILDIDSPGGSVFGVQELGDEIYAAREKIKITAIANSLAASAAYWLGSQASEFYVTPGGEVGSIGVWMAHEDWSAALAEAGINVTLISAGEFKTEGHPYGPLPEEAQKFMQSRVDDYYGAFKAAVARGRGVARSVVTGGMGKGRVLGAEAAKGENMVDGVMTYADLVKQKQSGQTTTNNRSRARKAERELQLIS